MPSRGSIRIGGQQVTGPLKISGMAFQAPSLLPWRTTVDNVLLPLEIVEPYRSSSSSRSAASSANAPAGLLASVGLGGYEDKFPGSSPAACSNAQHLPRADPRAEDAAARRALRRARRVHARGVVVHAARPARGAEASTSSLVTHDLRESVFLADTVYVMSRSPGRLSSGATSTCRARATWRSPTRRPSPTSCTNCAGNIGAMRKTGVGAGRSRNDAKALQTWALGSLLVVLPSGRRSAADLRRLRVHLPSPAHIGSAIPSSSVTLILGHAWRTFWVTMVGLASRIVVGVLLGFLIGSSRWPTPPSTR